MKRNRVKRSIVWKMIDEDFIKLTKSSNSICEICDAIKARRGGSVFSNIKTRIKQLNIDISHFIDHRKNKNSFNYVDEKSFLHRLENNKISDTTFIKKKLLEFSLVKNECSKCQLLPMWNGLPLTFHLDHIDGDSDNNTLSNLRLLCPNCHTQTETFSMGKSRKRKTYECLDCGIKTSGYGKRCLKCASKFREEQKMVGKVGNSPTSIQCQ